MRFRPALALASFPALIAAALIALAEPEPSRAQTDTGDGPLVAAASDLQFALPALAEAFTAKTGAQLRLTFGSSGNLMRQIEQGAPFDLFLSADESYVRRLVDGGHTQADGALYAIGRLVLMVPDTSPLAAVEGLDGLAAALKAGRIARFAIANPAHAPYGKRAKEALQHKGLWETIEPHLLLGENVSQAAQFAATAEAAGGLVALSLAKSARLAEKTRSTPVPADWHAPLHQRMVLLAGADETAERFYAFLQSPAARDIFARYGFRLPAGAS